MIADVADYSEWKNNRRATAIIFSAMLCGLKIGLSVGGALVAGILAHHGYQAGAEQQPQAVVDGIRLTVYDPTLAEQMEVAEQVMRSRRTLLHKLAQ